MGCGVDVLGGMSVLVGWGVNVSGARDVFVGCGVDVKGDMDVLAGCGSDGEVRPNLWQLGSALSIKPSPSSSLVLKQYSLPPVSGINVTGGISQMMSESKRISASGLSMVSTNKPTSPLA